MKRYYNTLGGATNFMQPDYNNGETPSLRISSLPLHIHTRYFSQFFGNSKVQPVSPMVMSGERRRPLWSNKPFLEEEEDEDDESDNEYTDDEDVNWKIDVFSTFIELLRQTCNVIKGQTDLNESSPASVSDGDVQRMTESANEYTDDEDVSWKVRRAAAKCLAALVVTRLEMLSKLYEKVKNLPEDESVPKPQGTKELSKEKIFADVLLESLEDLEEVHVIDGAKNRKRRNLIEDEDEISDEDKNKCKK
ncbi:Cullin-associated NEDD8-dissociated protein 1 [Datura stramonium]|uniref:Cullin-associated NEDD8-dissociated protein 1 n=1 Tax=Datura stramonium TaxID=4076 RepID=A0ABS8TAD8_DATST|nr:Cullin-associated NEDD8-dissociated protein 1 [Datura stramonium]